MKSNSTKMSRRAFAAAAVALTTAASANAFAWDPIGDLQNPGRILRNIEREANQAGRTIDRARLEMQAQAGAPAFEQWLIASRNTAASGGVSAIPLQIRRQLTGFVDEDILNRVRFKVGDSGVFNLAQLSIRYGEAAAVTLIDVVVFKSAQDAFSNPRLWAHELKHVQQFRDWGVRDFAIRYLRSWNGVENEAHAFEDAFGSWRNRVAQTGGTQVVWNPSVGNFCGTPAGRFGPGPVNPLGSPCQVMMPWGPVPGRVVQ